MAESQTTDAKPKLAKRKKGGISPHLPWEVPTTSPNQGPKKKGQLGQNVRQREQAERQKSY